MQPAETEETVYDIAPGVRIAYASDERPSDEAIADLRDRYARGVDINDLAAEAGARVVRSQRP
jgi:hypothetical protein